MHGNYLLLNNGALSKSILRIYRSNIAAITPIPAPKTRLNIPLWMIGLIFENIAVMSACCSFIFLDATILVIATYRFHSPTISNNTAVKNAPGIPYLITIAQASVEKAREN